MLHIYYVERNNEKQMIWNMPLKLWEEQKKCFLDCIYSCSEVERRRNECVVCFHICDVLGQDTVRFKIISNSLLQLQSTRNEFL